MIIRKKENDRSLILTVLLVMVIMLTSLNSILISIQIQIWRCTSNKF